MIKKPFLSVVIPVYNEHRRINNLKIILDYFANKKYSCEVIVVDDGSTDDTLLVIREYRSLLLKTISYTKNQGKGFAVKTGMLAANGEWRLFMDIDLSIHPSQADLFLSHVGGNYDLLIGSRKCHGAQIIDRQKIIRELLGKVFIILSSILVYPKGIKITDFTCGFKMFCATAADKIFSHSFIKRWGFDSEVLFLANKYNLNFREIPVVWHNRADSKVRFPQDVIRSFIELFQVFYNDLLGRYQIPPM